MNNDVLASLKMMLTFAQNDVVPDGTNEKIQADWLGFFVLRQRKRYFSRFVLRIRTQTSFML